MTGTRLLRAVLSILFVAAGVLHLVMPERYRGIMPSYLPAHDRLIAISGIAEILGGIGLLVRRTRRVAGWGLILLLFTVLPANVEMLRVYRAHGGAGWGELLLWARLPFQLVLAAGVAAAMRATPSLNGRGSDPRRARSRAPGPFG